MDSPGTTMLMLDTLNVVLAANEKGLIEKTIVTSLASSQSTVFFEELPRLKAIVTDDIPRWREALHSRLKDVRVSSELTEEMVRYR